MRTALITSAAYVGAELSAEFGPLPPAFLPVGNQRLFVRQHASLAPHFDRILLSIPDDFHVPEPDIAHLRQLGIELVAVPGGLDLPGSILHAVAECNVETGSLAVLHGDTLLSGTNLTLADTMSAAPATNAYKWAGFDETDGRITSVFGMGSDELGRTPVLSGFFHFADVNALVLSLAAARGSFVAALDRYVKRRAVVALDGGDWFDFGHLHTYYASRSRITTERAFNALAVGKRIVAKTSVRANRIAAEAGWYEQVPPELRIYLPNYIGRADKAGESGYRVEFLHLPSLADLFVFGRLPEPVWTQLLQSVADFLTDAARHQAPADVAMDAMELYAPKTRQRLEEFASATGIDLNKGWTLNGVATPGLREIAEQSAEWITTPEPRHLSIVHGDACFSNILYDFRSLSVRLIDPRGQNAAGMPTIWGDNRYELAKLHHSVIGNYDLIIAGQHLLEVNRPSELTLTFPSTPSLGAARAAFNRVFADRLKKERRSIEAISLHLFLSMLPLHADSAPRQHALLANALRLFLEQSAKVKTS